ncbi:MAG: hypothetical protein NDI73_08620 [Desulfuromonadales bacterium]|nr:hypothetical protein [Desulfuromonadales bacterium]
MTLLAPRNAILLLILLTLGVYYPTFFAPLNSLDDLLYAEKLLNQTGFTFRQHFSPGGTSSYYRPLLTLTFELDRIVGGGEEMFMHSMNIAIHLCNVLLVYLLSQAYCRLYELKGEAISLLAAALFCLHPINTEAVNWIAGRTDLLAGTFVFLALIALLKSLETQSLWWGAAAACVVLFGSLCKETALFAFPGMVLLLWRTPLRCVAWRRRWWIVGFFGVAILSYLALRWQAFHYDRGLGGTVKFVTQAVGGNVAAVPQAIEKPSEFPWFDFSRDILKVSGYYAVKLLQPLPLNFAIDRVSNLYLVPGGMLVGLLVILFHRDRPAGRLLLISFGLATSALLVIVTRQAWTPVAERYMYIPTGPFVIGVTIAFAQLTERARRQGLIASCVALLLLGMVVVTAQRNVVWQDNLTLYEDAVKQSPGFAPAKNQLALALYAHGRAEEAAALIGSIRISGGELSSLNQAAILRKAKRFDEARHFLLERLNGPGTSTARIEARILEMLLAVNNDEFNQGINDVGRRKERLQEMLDWLKRLETLTKSPFFMYRQGYVNLLLGNRDEAQKCFAEAVKRFPDDSPYKGPAQKLAKDLEQ